MSRTVFVVNPRSAAGATGKEWRGIAAKLRDRLGDFGELFTTRPMEAEILTRRALEEGADRVVAVGGDGTVNEVCNGFFNGAGRPVNVDAQLGIVPRGTGGDFRRTFGWEAGLEAAVSRLSSGKQRRIDVGRLTYTGHEGDEKTRYFLNIASFGSSGLIDKIVNESSKALGGKLSFMLGSARGMLGWKDLPVRLRFDGGAWEEHAITCVAVANGQYFGGGMWVAPDARPDDGLFDVTIWSGYTLSDFVLKSRAIYDGRHVEFSGTRTRQARTVEAECATECLLDVDGEAPGRLPARFELVPGGLSLLG